MATPVVTVASGGLPVVDVTATTGRGTPVTEAASGRGTAVTKVVGKPGMSVVYSTVVDWPPSGVVSSNAIVDESGNRIVDQSGNVITG